jgi:hypothetical protein
VTVDSPELCIPVWIIRYGSLVADTNSCMILYFKSYLESSLESQIGFWNILRLEHYSSCLLVLALGFQHFMFDCFRLLVSGSLVKHAKESYVPKNQG